jgi:signal transduction histidine kinase
MMQAPMSWPPPRPLRFVWQMDADARLTISDEFAALAGAPTVALLGQPWGDVAATLDLDPEDQVARAIASRETFSALAVAWPAGERRLAVELSGLPVFDRERVFRGYRGFGICREPAPPAAEATAETAACENVVPLHSPAEAASPVLNAVERSAFHELARRLTERLGDGGAATLANPGGPADTLARADRLEVAHAQAEIAEARSEAEKASTAKSDFLARLSHEIRNPLTAIIGFSELMLQERFGPIGNDRYRQYLKDIHGCGEHLIALVNDLLDLSKIEAGKLELAFTGLALNELTQQCVAVMAAQASRERIIVRTALAPKLPPVIADARAVRQIVLNLLSNSIKFTGAGGQVIVSTARTDSGAVVLRVRDTGAGMSKQELSSALEPFRQFATARNASGGGSGLGLPLTKALAEANRARFHISSTPKVGTLVEVTFRASQTSGE